MLIGLDFDNTLARYDRVFSDAARALGFIDAAGTLSKLDIRTRVRALDDGERKWMALQGEVYGKRMQDAELMPGAAEFLAACRDRKIDVAIVSHKTEYGHYDPDRVNLRDAAGAWMRAQGFFDAAGFGLDAENVYFEGTRPEKIKRISALGCSHFVDDLEEIFRDPGFPPDVTRILYDPDGSANDGPFERYSDWKNIEHAILGR